MIISTAELCFRCFTRVRILGIKILIVKFLDKILYLLYNYVTFLNNTMTQVTESGGRQNIYSIEPRPYLDESYEGYPQERRETNGRCKKQ